MTPMRAIGTISKIVLLLKFIQLVNGDYYGIKGDCWENTEIISSTIQVFNTKSVAECMAACQALLLCEYWTLDTENHICKLKETNVSRYYMDPNQGHYWSGKKFCHFCFDYIKEVECDQNQCGLLLNEGQDWCGDDFILQLLSSDIGRGAIEVYVDWVFMGTCEAIDYTHGSNPPFFTCGKYPIPRTKSYFLLYLRGSNTLNLPKSSYNGNDWNIHIKVLFPTHAPYDFFFPSNWCPNVSEIERLTNCNDVSCGGYCTAHSTLPHNVSNWNINNCLIDGNYVNIFVRICNGETQPTVKPSHQPPTAHPLFLPTTHPSVYFPTTGPTWYPTQHPTSVPTAYPVQRPTSENGNWFTSKIFKCIVIILAALSGFLLYSYVFRIRLARLNQAAIDQIGVEDREFENSAQSLSLDPGKSYRRVGRSLLSKEYSIYDLEVGKLLGSGSFSKVHLVIIKESGYLQKKGTKVAGKLINSKSGFKAKDFLNEVLLLNLVSNECEFIINFIGIVVKPNIILLEYYRNGSLDEVLIQDYEHYRGNDGTKFPILLRLKFMLQLCHAVKHLQKHRIVHRDLASRNLLLSDDCARVVLTDFGLARKINLGHDVKNDTYITAIPRTSPPESWTMRKKVFCPKTDVWGVGMTIFEILNMRPIIKMLTELICIEGTEAMKPKKLILDDITFGKSFTRFEELLLMTTKCWYKDPEERPQISEVEAMLKDFCCYPLLGDKYITKYIHPDERKYKGFNDVDFDHQFDSGSEVLTHRLNYTLD